MSCQKRKVAVMMLSLSPFPKHVRKSSKRKQNLFDIFQLFMVLEFSNFFYYIKMQHIFPIVLCNQLLSIKVVLFGVYQLACVVFSILLGLSFAPYFKGFVISKV